MHRFIFALALLLANSAQGQSLDYSSLRIGERLTTTLEKGKRLCNSSAAAVVEVALLARETSLTDVSCRPSPKRYENIPGTVVYNSTVSAFHTSGTLRVLQATPTVVVKVQDESVLFFYYIRY